MVNLAQTRPAITTAVFGQRVVGLVHQSAAHAAECWIFLFHALVLRKVP
jgi:hypothetical protein